MAYLVDVPASAFETKASFYERPSIEVVREIRAHIKATGQPFTWRGHTHTKPPDGARIVYLGEFDLPKSHEAEDRWSPCPCCTPLHTKYRKNGKIGWFPDEGVIRCIGPNCFQSLNPEGHWEAVENMRAEEAHRRSVEYLLQNLDKVPNALAAIDKALPTVRAVDDVKTALSHRLERLLNIRLWPHIREGVLRLITKETKIVKDRTGDERTVTTSDFRNYASLRGHLMLKPDSHALAPKLAATRKRLSFIDFGNEIEQRVAQMNEEERTKAARILSKSIEITKNLLQEANEMREFLSPISIATMNRWSRQEGCPEPVHIEREGTSFLIGTSEHNRLRLPVAPEFFSTLPEPPRLGTL